MGEILALWKSIVKFPLTSVKPGYYSTCWRFKCLLYLLGQVSLLHNAADLYGVTSQFDGGNISSLLK